MMLLRGAVLVLLSSVLIGEATRSEVGGLDAAVVARGSKSIAVPSDQQCAQCGKRGHLCDSWRPGWPGGQEDSAACALCISGTSTCLGNITPTEWCNTAWSVTHCALTCCRRHLSPPAGQQRLSLTFVSQSTQPVIDTLASPGTEDNQFGFEGGRVVKEGGRYYYFAAEMFAQPLDANMRVSVWSASKPMGPWLRERTIQQSNQSYPLVQFTQQCNQPYCAWKGAMRNRFVMQMQYSCDPDDLLAAPWAPFPIFNEQENVWHVLYVSYTCDGTWFVAVGGGNIFGARSLVHGRAGITGPYRTYRVTFNNSSNRWCFLEIAKGLGFTFTIRLFLFMSLPERDDIH